MEVGERIKKRRIELNMTQSELAEKVGYTSRSAIAKIEANANGILQSKLNLFANALSTTPAYLLGWVDGSPEQKKNDAITDIILRLRSDDTFNNIITEISKLSEEQLKLVEVFLSAFKQQNIDKMD